MGFDAELLASGGGPDIYRSNDNLFSWDGDTLAGWTNLNSVDGNTNLIAHEGETALRCWYDSYNGNSSAGQEKLGAFTPPATGRLTWSFRVWLEGLVNVADGVGLIIPQVFHNGSYSTFLACRGDVLSYAGGSTPFDFKALEGSWAWISVDVPDVSNPSVMVADILVNAEKVLTGVDIANSITKTAGTLAISTLDRVNPHTLVSNWDKFYVGTSLVKD